MIVTYKNSIFSINGVEYSNIEDTTPEDVFKLVKNGKFTCEDFVRWLEDKEAGIREIALSDGQFNAVRGNY